MSSGLPDLQKVVIVPYVSSAGQDDVVDGLKNGLVASQCLITLKIL